MNNLKKIVLIFLVNTLIISTSFAHDDDDDDHDEHAEHGELTKNDIYSKSNVSEIMKQKYQQINQSYLADIKPILKQSCFNCHSNHTVYPWYYKIPGVKQFIDHDIEEAREHIDFSKDFPFLGHASTIKDLKAIEEELEEGEMPPMMYNLMHSKEKMSEQQKQTIFKWVKESVKILEEN